MDNPKRYFRVENDSKDIYMTWSEPLLSQADLTAWKEYKTHEMDGKTDQEQKTIKDTPVAERLKSWASINRIGVEYQSEMFKKGVIKSVPQNYSPEYMFHLPLGTTVVSDSQHDVLKRYEKQEIVHKLEAGQVKPTVTFEGFLKFTEISPSEYEMMTKPKSVPSKDQVMEIVKTVKK